MYLESFVYHMRDAAFAAREMHMQQIHKCTFNCADVAVAEVTTYSRE